MILGISSNGKSKSSLTSERFARAPFFVIYNKEEKSFVYVDNIAKEENSGAGAKASKILFDHNVDVVLVPKLGPKSVKALEGFEIKAYQYPEQLNVEEVILLYLESKLPLIES